jgi:hypothetical protein
MEEENQEILDELISVRNNLKWISDNEEKLRKKYPCNFIAMKDNDIVLADKNFDNLLTKLREKFGSNISEFNINFIPDEGYALVV